MPRAIAYSCLRGEIQVKSSLYVLLLAAVLCGHGIAQSTQTPEGLKQYVPVLPSVKEKFWPVDPKLGYAMKPVGGGVYVITDDGWQFAFLVTDDGVVVFRHRQRHRQAD